MRAQDEAEVWADGYGFVEFHESQPAKTTLPTAASAPLTDDHSVQDGTDFTLLA